MAYLKAPDLRKYLLEVLEDAKTRWPDLVDQSDIDRIEGANNVLLVATRVLHLVIKRGGVTDKEAEDIVRRSKWIPEPVSMDTKSETEGDTVTGIVTIHDALWEVDKVLHHPGHRQKLPDWFVNSYWPGVLRRVASGGRVTYRDKEIALYWAAIARGER